LCETDYIAYIDDDAVPYPEWLAAIIEAFETTDAAVVAGPILPVWPGPIPEWLPTKYAGCLTILNHGPADRPLREGEFAFGANMAFAVEALRAIGGFNLGIGRTGARNLLSEEEIEIQLVLRDRGYTSFYAASAKVSHVVHRDRVSRSYFRARMSWQGVSALLRNPPIHFDHWSPVVIKEASAKLGLQE